MAWELVQQLNRATTLRALAFSPNGEYLALGGNSGECFVYETDDWSLVATLDEIGDRIFTIDWSADNGLLAYAGSGGAIVYVHETEDWTLEQTVDESVDNLETTAAVTFVGSDRLAFGSDFQSTAYVYTTDDWTLEQALDGPNGGINDIAGNISTDQIALASNDDFAYVYERDGGSWSLVQSFDEGGFVEAVAYDGDELLATGRNNGEITVRETSNWATEASLDIDEESVSTIHGLEFSTTGDYLGASSSDENVYIFETDDWTVDQTLSEASNNAIDISWELTDAEWVAYASYDQSVYVHDEPTEIVVGAEFASVADDVGIDEAIAIDVDVTNPASVAKTRTVDIELDAQTIHNQSRTINPKQTDTISISHLATPDLAGESTLTGTLDVEGEFGSTTVTVTAERLGYHLTLFRGDNQTTVGPDDLVSPSFPEEHTSANEWEVEIPLSQTVSEWRFSESLASYVDRDLEGHALYRGRLDTVKHDEGTGRTMLRGICIAHKLKEGGGQMRFQAVPYRDAIIDVWEETPFDAEVLEVDADVLEERTIYDASTTAEFESVFSEALGTDGS